MTKEVEENKRRMQQTRQDIFLNLATTEFTKAGQRQSENIQETHLF